MLRVVLDTNIRYSALLFGGQPQRVDFFCQAPNAIQIVSGPLLAELRRVLTPKMPGYRLDAEIERIETGSDLVTPVFRVSICRDPDDNRILECAIAGRADLIVSGDKDLLVLGSYEGIPILTVRQFVESHLR